jgi:hypothetical protein
MRTEIQKILQRQAEWQRSRIARSWGEKLRESAAMRRSVMNLKEGSPKEREPTPKRRG